MEHPAAKASLNIAKNLKALRQRQNLTQNQIARISGLSRPMVALLESGTANPTLEVLLKLARGLGIALDELISSATAECRLIKAQDVPVDRRSRPGVTLRKLLPDRLPATEMDELSLMPDAVLTGVPHIDGTREYFTCIKGELSIGVLGEVYHLKKGDVLTFPGDKPHSYKNNGRGPAQGISVVLFSSEFTHAKSN